jgi:hypothetical protein
MVIGISTTYRRDGLLFDKWAKHHGKSDADVLAIRQPSAVYNPTLEEDPSLAAEIAEQLAADPERAAAEWLSQWRSDLSDFIDRELVAAAVDPGIIVRPPVSGDHYLAATDPSGGRGDPFTAAVGHTEDKSLVIDCIYERRAPFDPETALDEVAALAREYGASMVHGDDYGADLIVSGFRRRGITYKNIAVRDDLRHLPNHNPGPQVSA